MDRPRVQTSVRLLPLGSGLGHGRDVRAPAPRPKPGWPAPTVVGAGPSLGRFT